MTIRIAQLSDIHVRSDWADFRRRDFFWKRATGRFNYRFSRAREYSEEVLGEAIGQVISAEPDLVVVSGDLSNLGLISEFEAARQTLLPIAEAGIPIAIIPGNHDYYTRSSRGAFEAVFREWQDHVEQPPPYPFRVRLNGVTVLCFNSAIVTLPFMAYGRLGPEQLKRARRMAREEVETGRQLVFAVHHHPTKAPNKRFDWHRGLRDGKELLELAHECGAELIMHGHNHHFEVRRIGPRGPLVVGLSSSTTSRRDKVERFGQIGLYTVSGREGLLEVAKAEWQGESEGFGEFEPKDVEEVRIVPHP